MRTERQTKRTMLLALLLAGGFAGCSQAPEATKDLADEVHKALDPKPDFVDQPADKPLGPQSTASPTD